jgi:hypothetical protein
MWNYFRDCPSSTYDRRQALNGDFNIPQSDFRGVAGLDDGQSAISRQTLFVSLAGDYCVFAYTPP